MHSYRQIKIFLPDVWNKFGIISIFIFPPPTFDLDHHHLTTKKVFYHVSLLSRYSCNVWIAEHCFI
jgi:hypothetical protein